MSLTICSCYLRLKNFVGSAFSSAELVYESRKSMVNSGDSLYIARPARVVASQGAVLQDLLFISNTPNPISPLSIAYTSGGTAGFEVVTVIDGALSVQIDSGVSTATQVKAAILASAPAVLLFAVLLVGTGTTPQVTGSVSSLTDEYALLTLPDTITDSQLGVFTLNWDDAGKTSGQIVFDPITIPNQLTLDLSTVLTVSRG